MSGEEGQVLEEAGKSVLSGVVGEIWTWGNFDLVFL